MPRKSLERLMSEAFLPRLEPLPVPTSMQPARARAIWQELTQSRPSDYFVRTDEPLLRLFCVLTARSEAVERLMAVTPLEAPDQPRFERRLVAISAALTGLSAKLRLNPQGRIERHASARSEVRRGPPPWHNTDLIGGHAARRAIRQ